MLSLAFRQLMVPETHVYTFLKDRRFASAAFKGWFPNQKVQKSIRSNDFGFWKLLLKTLVRELASIRKMLLFALLKRSALALAPHPYLCQHWPL